MSSASGSPIIEYLNCLYLSAPSRGVVAHRTDGGAGADTRAPVPAARADPDCPCPRSSLAAKGYFDSQHAKEGLRPP